MIKNRAKVVPNMSVLGSVWHDLGTILGHTNRPSGGPKVQTQQMGILSCRIQQVSGERVRCWPKKELFGLRKSILGNVFVLVRGVPDGCQI